MRVYTLLSVFSPSQCFSLFSLSISVFYAILSQVVSPATQASCPHLQPHLTSSPSFCPHPFVANKLTLKSICRLRGRKEKEREDNTHIHIHIHILTCVALSHLTVAFILQSTSPRDLHFRGNKFEDNPFASASLADVTLSGNSICLMSLTF